jgi:serine/threonine protein kinase
MTAAQQDLTTTRFVLPPDAKLLSVEELAPRLRAKIGPAESSDVVVTRPGFRVTTRLVTTSLAALLTEFRSACLLTDAITRFSRTHRQDAQEILELSFDALATFIDGRILVAADSSDVAAAAPSLAAGQAVADMEIVHLVRALDDTEVYRVRMADGAVAALKIARDDRAADMLAREAKILALLDGGDTPRLLAEGRFEGRLWLAMEWRHGVPVSVAAQQLRASGDRRRLHRLVIRLLEGYARLHEAGIVHGDIHPSNILADDRDAISILDFGRAGRTAESPEMDASRAGIAHFHDPQMATALLAGMVPPAASAVAEQYALAVLAYLLLTGLYPVEPAANHSELLTRIVTRPPLPFAARGVDAWPRVESALRRALAKDEAARFADTAEFARTMRETGIPRRRTVRRYPHVERVIRLLRNGESLPGCDPAGIAWVSLRAALARSDAELLAVASHWALRSGKGLEAAAIAAHVAHARSDQAELQNASGAFVAAARALRHEETKSRALLEAAAILGNSVVFDLEPLKEWARISLVHLWTNSAKSVYLIQAALALVQAGTIAQPTGVYAELGKLKAGSVWLWGQAFDLWQQAEHLERACAASVPRNPLLRGLSFLRLHQLTGEMRWVAAARRIATHELCNAPDVDGVRLAIELEMPARAMAMPYH